MGTAGETDHSWKRAKRLKENHVLGDQSNCVKTKRCSADVSPSKSQPLARHSGLGCTSTQGVILANVYHRQPKNFKEKLALIRDALHEFSGISTIHGVRYVLADEICLFRRFLWFCLVVFLFGIFTRHCLVQYNFYMGKRTHINIKKIYTDFSVFPAVTICNDNLFRISDASKHGLLNVIKNLFEGDLTLHDAYIAGVANLTLDQLNSKAGNRIENMLLSCKWQGKKACDATNFSTVMTDYGLCFTLNGPDNPSSLIASSPGSSRGLELALNIEEYERMAGPRVGSGIHILVQNRRDYPLVKQKGRAIAAGKYSFVALQIKKELRLGRPYTDCVDGRSAKVTDKKYRYSMATCQVDCYTSFVVNKCGCKDFYLPGDAPVCSFVQYVTCLRDAKDEYHAARDKVCQCYNPCYSEYLESFFSYSALSKDAHNVLSPGETVRIMERFKRALDVNEYYNAENQYKKSRYRNFTQSVNRLYDFYDVFGARINTVMNNIMKVGEQAELITMMSEEILNAQMCIYENGFVSTRQSYDLKLIEQLAEDHMAFCEIVLRKIKTMSETVDDNVRDLLFILYKGTIHGRMQIILYGVDHMFYFNEAFKSGSPLVRTLKICVKLKYFQDIDPNIIIPRATLQEAVSRSHKILAKGNYTRSNLKDIFEILENFWGIGTAVFTNKNLTEELRHMAIAAAANYSERCNEYLKEQLALQKEMIEWPTKRLSLVRDGINNKKVKCKTALSDYVNELKKISKGLNDFKVYFKEYRKIIPVLNHYLMYFNVSKFKIAELFSDRNSQEVHSRMEEFKESIFSRIDKYENDLNEVLECYNELYQEIFKNGDIIRAFKLNGDRLNVSVTYGKYLFDETFKSLNELKTLSVIRPLHKKHLALAELIQMDAMKFTNQAVIDVKFYSKNFIFLNIFFSELSYTITEQRVAISLFNLISDIGGTMGLLAGGSVVSLFELLDFVICLCVSLLKWTP